MLGRLEDYANDVLTIFETWAAAAADGRAPHVRIIIDVGANQGQTGRLFLRLFPLAVVHSFELSAGTFGILRETRGKELANAQARWHLHNLGMAAEPGTKAYSPGRVPGDQTATLGEAAEHGLGHGSAVATITTVALALEELKLDFVDLLKVDTEGWDRDVLKGADLARNAARFGAVFFEYGSTWYDTRSGPSSEPLEEVVAAFAAVGFECFLSGRADLARLGGWKKDLRSGVMGYGPNVLCLNSAQAASSAILGAHRDKLEQCAL